MDALIKKCEFNRKPLVDYLLEMDVSFKSAKSVATSIRDSLRSGNADNYRSALENLNKLITSKGKKN